MRGGTIRWVAENSSADVLRMAGMAQLGWGPGPSVSVGRGAIGAWWIHCSIHLQMCSSKTGSVPRTLSLL